MTKPLPVVLDYIPLRVCNGCETIGDMTTATEMEHKGIGNVLREKRLAVPIYQRSYSWTESEIDDLFNDFESAFDDEEYFLGTLVITKADKKGVQTVIDGQQRLASVLMIFSAMRDLLATDHKKTADAIGTEYLYTEDKWSQVQYPRLELSNEDRDFFGKYVLAHPSSPERLKEVGARAADSNRRIAEAFDEISNRLKQKIKASKQDPIEVLKAWDNFLQNTAKVIVITVVDEGIAYQIFETLNDRGLDLTIADLLKNYIFGRAEEKFEQIRHQWTTAITKVSSDGGERVITKFIHHFWASKHGLIRERLLYKDIRERIRSSRQAAEFAAELHASSGHYAAILNSDHELWASIDPSAREMVRTLRDLKMEQYRPLLLAVLDTFEPGSKEILKVLRSLVSWSVRFRISHQLGSSKLEQMYGNAGQFVREHKIKTAKELIAKIRPEVPSDSLFQSDFATFEEENSKFSKYYLRAIENELRRGTADIVNPGEAVNLEHIFPKEPVLSDWPTFTSDSGPIFLHRLGNQTLLLKAQNKKLGNQPYSKKVEVYKNSGLKLTEKIGTVASWTPEEIEARQKWMASVALRVWSVG